MYEFRRLKNIVKNDRICFRFCSTPGCGQPEPRGAAHVSCLWDLAKIKSQLEKLGFYDGVNTQTKKIEKKETGQTNDANDITKQLTNLIEMYESGSINKEEFEKAKKKLLD